MIPGTLNKSMELSLFGTMDLQTWKPHTTKLCSNQPLQLQPNFNVIRKHRCRWLQARSASDWMSGFIWPAARQQTDSCFPKGLPNFASQTENDHLWTWMTGLSNLFSHHINPEATQVQGVLCQDALHHPALNFSIAVKTQRSNSAGLINK